MPTPNDVQLGRLAVQRGLTTEERVRECLELQRKNRAVGYDEPLSAILAKRGFIGEADRRALEKDLVMVLFVKGEQLFARLCVERGVLAREEARALLNELRAEGFRTRVGELLVERGKLDRAQREAIAQEVVRVQDEEERLARESDATAAAPAPTTPPRDEPTGELALAGSQAEAKAMASYDRDQRRFSKSGEWVQGALPKIDGFELEQRLGQGPNGVVYRAKPAGGGAPVGLKVLAPSVVTTPGFIQAIKRAWALAQRVDHATFVKLGSPGRTGDLVYFTMDLVEGESLQKTIERNGPLPSERVLALVRALLQGLEKAHQLGAVHGALSPENVFISRSTGWPVVTDLPLAGLGIVGQEATALYASPQRLTGATQPLPADDVYALACVAYYAVVGRPPFPDPAPTTRLVSGAPDPRETDAAIDARLATLIERGTRPDAAERLDVAQALALVEAGRGRASSGPLPQPQAPLPPRASERTERADAPKPPQPPRPPRVPTAPTMFAAAPESLDRTVLMPKGKAGVLPTPPRSVVPVHDAVERTMEVAPPAGARLADLPESTAEEPGSRTIELPAPALPPPADDGMARPAHVLADDDVELQRTIVTAPPAGWMTQDADIERTINVPPPAGSDTGSGSGSNVGAATVATGWSQFLRDDQPADSTTGTQPMAVVPKQGIASTLRDAPPPLPGPLKPLPAPPARPPRTTALMKTPADRKEPAFDLMGETAPMKPLGSSEDDLTGRLIHSRYRVLSKLGQGGMGIVYRAEHTLMGRAVAFKVLNPELVKSAESVARFKREIMATAQFHHRNVVRIFDAGATEEGRFYMAMELVDGPALSLVLHEGPVPLARFARIMAQLLRGVSEGHKRGIIHRDLKSENILLTTEGGDEVVKIMDFGIAKVLWEGEAPQSQSNAFLTTERMAVGTPEYMSPEQASGGAKIDARSDIYSIGVLAYEMLTGRLPFDADSPVGYIGKHIVDPPLTFKERAPNLDLPVALEHFVMRALEKDPESRFPTAEAMLVALEQTLPEHAAAVQSAAVDTRQSRSAAPGPASPQGSAARKPPPPPPETVSGSGEVSSELARPAPSSGGALVLKLLLGLAAVAMLLLGTIVALVVTRPKPPTPSDPSTETPAGAVLNAAWLDRVRSTAAARQFGDARKLLEQVKPGEGASPELVATYAEEVKLLDDVEATWTRLEALGKSLDGAIAAVKQAVEREELAKAEAALGQARDLGPEAAKVHARLVDLKFAALAGQGVPGADLPALDLEVARLRQLAEVTGLAEGLLNAGEYMSAVEKLELALTLTRRPARKDELDATRRVALAKQLVAQARQEMKLPTADYAKIIADLQKAEANAPSNEAKELLDIAVGRQAEKEKDDALREVQGLVTHAREVGARDPAAALDDLEKAKQRVDAAGIPDTWKLPTLIAAARAARDSRVAHAALPRVGEAATLPELDAAIAKRKEYLEGHPAGHEHAAVATELAALERRRLETSGHGPRAAHDQLVADARQKLTAGALDEAQELAERALAAASAGNLDQGPAQTVLDRIDDARRLARTLGERFVPSGSLRMGKYEVTNGEYFAFCVARLNRARKANDPKQLAEVAKLWPGGWTVGRDKQTHHFERGKGELPVGNVSFRDAEAYCAWLSEELGAKVRLPTEAEWIQAATGGDQRAYPWGPSWDGKLVASHRTSAGPLPVDADLGGTAACGAFHMAGNIAEWVDTPYQESPDDEPDPSTRILKGGSYKSSAGENLAVTARVPGGTALRQPEWGFRVVVEN